MKRFIALFFLFPSIAFADDTKEYTFHFNQTDLNVVGTALSARPYGEVAMLMGKIQSQIREQEMAKKLPSTPIPMRQEPKDK